MPTKNIYEERLSSSRTEALFVVLTLLFLSLSAWRGTARGRDRWVILLFCLFDEVMKLLQEMTAPERFARAAAVGQQIQGGQK